MSSKKLFNSVEMLESKLHNEAFFFCFVLDFRVQERFFLKKTLEITILILMCREWSVD